MKSRLYPSLLVAAAFAVILFTAARADDTTVNTVKFSDPAKPGTLRIRVARGDIRIRGTDATDISVKSDTKPDHPGKPRKDGLRELTHSSSYSLVEKDNVVTLDFGLEMWGSSNGDFNLTVPRSTAIVISNSWGGDITCSDLTGDVEIKSLNGEVKLDNLAGGALVETMNGEIHATIRELHDGKPLSFTSTNGEVVLRVPADAKANVRLRTQNGSILTDFDEKVLVTKTEIAPRSGRSRAPRTVTGGNDVLPPEAREAIHEAVRAGAEAAREAAQAIREATQAAREGARDSSGYVAPMPPIPPIPPLPPMTGGKIVAGTLNGGGPEIQAATMNGDVTLRTLAEKK